LEVIGVRRSMVVGLFILLMLGLATPAWAQDALGGLVWFAAVVFGLGALLVAIWRARTPSRAAPQTATLPGP
jgi:hypothetical protein